jgi:hypothetical protein
VIYDRQHGKIDNGFGILRDYSYKPKKVAEKEKRRTSERVYGSRDDKKYFSRKQTKTGNVLMNEVN